MTKYAIITDTHFGVRGGSDIFLDLQIDFFQNFFLPEIKRRGITKIIHAGDVFDVRKNISIKVLSDVKKHIIEPLTDYAEHVYMIVGNHDCYYKNTNKYNSPKELLSDYKNIEVIDDYLIEDDITFTSWICQDNQERLLKLIDKPKTNILIGHFEIDGFEMHSGIVYNGGLKKSMFKKFDLVVSGHFHKHSKEKNITYLGTQYEMSWADSGDQKGFGILDTETKELEYIKYENPMFIKLHFDEEKIDIEPSQFDNKFLKLFVGEVKSKKKFEKYLNKLKEANILDLKIIEDGHLSELNEDIEIVEFETTEMLIDKYIDEQDYDTKDRKKEIKSIMRELYNEAVEIAQ